MPSLADSPRNRLGHDSGVADGRLTRPYHGVTINAHPWSNMSTPERPGQQAAPEPQGSADRSAQPRRRSGGRIAAAVGVGTVVLLGGVYAAGYALSGGTMPPQTTVGGVAVGGQSPEQAEATLTRELAAREQAPLTVTAGEFAVTKAPADAGLAVDHAASIRAAGAQKSFDPRVMWQNFTGGAAHEPVVVRDDTKLDALASELAQQADSDPTNAELAITEGRPELKEAVPGRALDVPATRDAVAGAYLTSTDVAAVVTERPADITTDEARQALETVATPALSAPVTITAGGKSFEVTPAMIAPALSFEAVDGALNPVLNAEVLAENADQAMDALGLTKPKDASFTFSDGRPTVVPSVDGKGVGTDALAAAVKEQMVKPSERAATLEVSQQQARFTTQDAEKLGVKEITGEFTTKFPATAYRVNNIGKSAGLVNGVLLKPGEVFSMNQVLGPRTLARGWQAGGAIDGGRVVERMGGGISQTTTTVFNAAFFAGLEDVVHKPHSLYFSRYPMGREATLDYNSVEMKFRNNSPHGVLLQAYTNNPKVGGQGTVTARVWSTKVYDVKATEPVQSNVKDPGPAIRSGAAVCSPQSAMRGFRVDYQRQFFQGGALVRSEPFHWTYNALSPVVCTNPNARPDRIER